MDALAAIRSRRTVRAFRPEAVAPGAVTALLEAARWAPSGLNNQPWRFFTVYSAQVRGRLAECTHYGDILRAAPVAVAVFLDGEASYDRLKDVQAIGAAVQNLLLAAHAQGLGACWLGEILNQRARVEELLGAPSPWELMAVIAVGHPAPGHAHGDPERRPLEELTVGETQKGCSTFGVEGSTSNSEP